MIEKDFEGLINMFRNSPSVLRSIFEQYDDFVQKRRLNPIGLSFQDGDQPLFSFLSVNSVTGFEPEIAVNIHELKLLKDVLEPKTPKRSSVGLL